MQNTTYNLRTFVENTQKQGIYPALREDLRVTTANLEPNLEKLVNGALYLGIFAVAVPVAILTIPVVIYDYLTGGRDGTYLRDKNYKF